MRFGRVGWKATALVGALVAAGASAAGCIADTESEGWPAQDADHTLWDAGPEWRDAGRDGGWQPPRNSRVYVNTKTSLYYIDPGESEDLVKVGDFHGPCTQGSGFYDIALDEDREMIAISEEGLYWVDTETAECSYAFQFPPDSPHFYSLSFVKGVFEDHPDRDALVAASAEDGEWVLIAFREEIPGQLFVHLGYYDPNFYKWRSSGDIVSFEVGPGKYETYATVRCETYSEPGCEADWLAEIDPTDGYARLIGKIVDRDTGEGYQEIYGLGFWGDRLYGFTEGGQYIHIDLETGQASLVQDFGQPFWGAGNTTRPYVVE